MSEPKIRHLLSEYLEAGINLNAVQERLLSLDMPEESELSRNILGILAEASHAGWTENQVRDTLRPFAMAGAPGR